MSAPLLIFEGLTTLSQDLTTLVNISATRGLVIYRQDKKGHWQEKYQRALEHLTPLPRVAVSARGDTVAVAGVLSPLEAPSEYLLVCRWVPRKGYHIYELPTPPRHHCNDLFLSGDGQTLGYLCQVLSDADQTLMATLYFLRWSPQGEFQWIEAPVRWPGRVAAGAFNREATRCVIGYLPYRDPRHLDVREYLLEGEDFNEHRLLDAELINTEIQYLQGEHPPVGAPFNFQYTPEGTYILVRYGLPFKVAFIQPAQVTQVPPSAFTRAQELKPLGLNA
jgi:hypothetical protein